MSSASDPIIDPIGHPRSTMRFSIASAIRIESLSPAMLSLYREASRMVRRQNGGVLISQLHLAKLESFYVGGESRSVRSRTYGSDILSIGAMYVQHMAPCHISFPYPIIFIHGGMHSGVTWETTPDGRDGWQSIFLQRGFETYVVDQSSRGRSAPDLSRFAGIDPPGPEPEVSIVGQSIAGFLGRGGTRFPMDHLRDHAAQLCPDFGMTKAVAKGHPGISAPEALPPFSGLLEKTGKAVLVTHSQGGDLGWQIAIAHPDHIIAIVAIEPSRTTAGLGDPAFPDIPVRVIWGDNIPKHASVLSDEDVSEGRALAALRANITLDVLPENGITGNGHMLMMESNNVEIAERIIVWLRSLA